MKNCIWCNKEFEPYHYLQKYCSDECHRLANNAMAMYKSRTGKKRSCLICGKELPKFRGKYCSDTCRRWNDNVKRGVCQDHGLLTKQCVICGKEFQTFKSRKITCSDECRKINSRPRRTPEQERERYRRKHPDARTMEEILEESKAKKEARAEEIAKRQAEREAEWAKLRTEKAKKKQENIDYWLHYEAEHECEICGNRYIAHYPTSKYCSDKCRKIKNKNKKRYKGITVDSDISLFKLAERDGQICQLCGLEVNWKDKIQTDKTVICGDMYPSIDHIKPISLGGLHSWSNIQLAHRGCNTKKHNKYIG